MAAVAREAGYRSALDTHLAAAKLSCAPTGIARTLVEIVASPGGKTKGLVVATRCTTLDEFIASFQRFCDESSFFVATLTTRPVGLETPFAILLADRSPVLRGLCTVLEAWTTPDNKYKVPGIRLGVKRLTVETAPVFARLRPRVPVVPPPAAVPPPLPLPGATRPLSVVLNPVPAGMRLPSTDMDTIPPPTGSRAITGTLVDAIPLPIINPEVWPRTTTPISMPFPDDAIDADPDLPAVDKDGRMPGSELVLPANPLMDLTDDSLKGFIDCTLYESSPGFTRGVPVELSAAELPVLERVIERARATIPPPFAIPPPEPPPEPEIEVVRPEPPPMTARIPVAVLPVHERPRRRWMLIAAPAMLAVGLIAFVAASASDADPGRPAPPEAPEPSTRVALAPPAPKPSQPAADQTSGQDDHTEDAEGAADPTALVDGVPLVGHGPCRVKISSTPAGSTVLVDGKVIGPSPILLAGPCQQRKVEVVHPRYKRAIESVTLVEGKPGSVEVTMSRPTHRLTVTTVPAGATVSIAGRRAGTSPTIVQLMGFSNLPITIEKTGYKPVSTRFYSKRADDKLNVKLSRW